MKLEWYEDGIWVRDGMNNGSNEDGLVVDFTHLVYLVCVIEV